MLQKYSNHIFCFLLSLLAVALYVNNFSFMEKLEWKLQDLMYSFKGDNPRYTDIVLVNIDQNTMDNFGEWPWRHDQIADLIAAIGSGEPKTILIDFPLESQNQIEDTINYTQILAGQLSWVNNVIVPYEFAPAEYIAGRISNPKYLYGSSVQVNSDIGILEEHQSLLAKKVFLPPDEICEYAAGLGFYNVMYDPDKKVRWEPLGLHYQGYYYPSATLLAAAHFRDIPPAKIKFFGGESVQMGATSIPTNKNGQLFINYSIPRESFMTVSAGNILNESYDVRAMKNKLIIINVASNTYAEYIDTPVDSKLPPAEKTANIIENIIHANFVNRMDKSRLADILALLGFGIIFAVVLPRVNQMYRIIILVAAFIVLANVNYILFNSINLLTRPMYIMLEMLILLIASPFLDRDILSRVSALKIGFEERPDKPKLPKVDLPEARIIRSEAKRVRPSAENMQTEMIDTIPSSGSQNVQSDPNRPTIVDGSSISATSAVDNSGQLTGQQFSPENSDAAFDPSLRKVDRADISQPLHEKPEPKPAFEPTPTNYSDSDPNIGSGPVNIKKLGRYEVIGVLGKGAMGMVYKGIDPAIDRYVALKTIRLDFVNDPTELQELRERLSREAKAAGMLSHPNIVTIYDVGAEGSLQYIAMEYLEGGTLEDLIRKKVKFNYKIIAQIATQICTALDFAHNQGIVHRDIKPANIMVLQDYRVKVMDFGIARVDSSSMTRTGIAMGTPNYISPEQLQGKPVDKRCDIFSLGVVLYEMLLGRRPFRGENLTSLIYSIVNSEAELPSIVNPSIPYLFDRIIEKALAKNPDSRYQHASEISAQLSDFVSSFVNK